MQTSKNGLNWLCNFIYTIDRANSSRTSSTKKEDEVPLSSVNGIDCVEFVILQEEKKNDFCFDTSVSFSHTNALFG